MSYTPVLILIIEGGVEGSVGRVGLFCPLVRFSHEEFNLVPESIFGMKKAIAIDSRLSPAKVRWRQPAVSSELSLVTAS